ncbi:MAG: ATP-binding protein, partial [Acidobacteriota bacterium]
MTAPTVESRPQLARMVALAGGAYLAAYAALSVVVSTVAGEPSAALGNLAQLVPPIGFAALAVHVARSSQGQTRVFWNLCAVHAAVWTVGQAVWTYYDVFRGGVPEIAPSDPIFFASSVPLAAALYGRPERERPKWLFDIVVLDIVLIALFAAFVYIYFVASIAVTGGTEEAYAANITQLFNARSLVLAVWAAWLWRTATDEGWRHVLGLFSLGLAVSFLGGLVYDLVEYFGTYVPGQLYDLGWMAPFAVMAVAAAAARDRELFTPQEAGPATTRMPLVSLIAVALLVLIPTTDEIARRVLTVSPGVEILRTRLALAMMIPFGIVVVVREFLSRRALLKAGQELVSTREQLAQSEKLAAVGQLVSGVAHELNNPLQGVLGYAELMVAANPTDAKSEELQAIRDNANRAAGIVRNLMTFAGKEAPARSWHQVNRLVKDAVLKREKYARLVGITIKLSLADRLPLIYLDGMRFEEVMRHLIDNAQAAIEARRQGQVLSVRVAPQVPGEILISTRQESRPERIVIEVSDNGSGVRTEDLSRVFDPFFTTRGPRDGAGLGLSVCYGIVREHGGQISGRNRDTGGAVFTVELPVAAESYPVPAA